MGLGPKALINSEPEVVGSIFLSPIFDSKFLRYDSSVILYNVSIGIIYITIKM